MFCKECGRKIDNESRCPYCGARNADGTDYGRENIHYERKSDKSQNEETQRDSYYKQDEYSAYRPRPKSRLTAGLLQLFVGGLGIGRFYMGYTLIGILQIVATILSCGIAGLIWGVVDGVLILCGNVKVDGYNNPLAD